MTPRAAIILALIAAAASPALDLRPVAAPDATLMAASEPGRLAQWRALTVDSYRKHGIHDPAWDHDLELLLEHVAALETGTRPAMDPREAAALARKLAEPGACRDPLAAWAAFAIGSPDQRTKTSAAVRAAAMFDGDAVARPGDAHPHFLRAGILAYLLECYGRPDRPAAQAAATALAKRLATEMGASLKAGECTACPELWLRQARDLDLAHQDFGEPVVAAIDAGVVDGHLAPWLADGLRGTIRIGNAWAWRSSGWAKDVTPEGWRGFEANLQQADAFLTKAWQENPKDPHIPAFGCTVAGAKKSRASMETWLLRSMTACFDCPDAFDTTLNFLEPRWGGSYDRMLALGCDCVDTGRFDTDVPWRLIGIVGSVMSDAEDMERKPDALAALANPRVQDTVDACLDGYVKAHPGIAAEASCYRAAIHALGGRADTARKALAGTPDAAIAQYAWIGGQWHVDLKALKGASGEQPAWSRF